MSFIDLVANSCGGSVFFGTNTPYISSNTYCNGSGGGAGPYCQLYDMPGCYLQGYSGNCCCQQASGYLRSIRVDYFY